MITHPPDPDGCLQSPAGGDRILCYLDGNLYYLGGEQLGIVFGAKDRRQVFKARYYGAGVLVAAATGSALIEQPTTAERWERLAPFRGNALESRSAYIHPAELLDSFYDHILNLIMIDVRVEADRKLFHLLDAINIPPRDIPARNDEVMAEPANTMFF